MRIRASFMQQRKDQGGVSLPNIELYFQAALLEHLLQWWNLPTRVHGNGNKGCVPLNEWAFSVRDQPRLC